jgi:hypothetical protein
VARVAEALAVSWNTANNAVLTEGRPVLIADPPCAFATSPLHRQIATANWRIQTAPTPSIMKTQFHSTTLRPCSPRR